MSNLLPDSSLSSPPVSLPYDLEACTELMRGGSKSFFAASRLLPVRLRPPAIALYAFAVWPTTPLTKVMTLFWPWQI